MADSSGTGSSAQSGKAVQKYAKTSLYSKPAADGGIREPLRVRAERVRRMVERIRKAHPHLASKRFDDALRSFCELEILSQTIFAWLMKLQVVNGEGEPRRLLDEHRRMKLAALEYGKQLGLTPASVVGMTGGDPNGDDLAAMCAKHVNDEPEDAEVVETRAKEAITTVEPEDGGKDDGDA